jgi:hypothetical protein
MRSRNRQTCISRVGEWQAPGAEVAEEGPEDSRRRLGNGSRLRSTFRDWASERTNYSRDVAEMALAHAIGDKVEAAYRRGDLFERRKMMMQDWANFVCLVPSDKVVSIVRRRA